MSEYDILINKYDALNADYDQLYPKPMKHANTHANGGTDPITPGDIGAYSKNETDLLLANKADTMVKVWENASPTSTFAPQTVSINLTGYPIIVVEDTYGDIYYFANPTTSDANLINIIGGGSIAAKIYKRLCKVGLGGIQFGSCVSISALNQTTTTVDDSKCIPLNIYGITM